MSARARVLALLLLLAGPAPAGAADDGYALLRRLLAGPAAERATAARALAERRDPALVPPLVDVYFFLPPGSRAEARAALAALTGEAPRERYLDWVELLGRRPDLAAGPGYAAFKGELLARIDPRYGKILAAAGAPRIRLEEVVSGGVPVEGIPALDRPPHVPAAAAGYLQDEERVFGVSVGGEERAYPLRILGWHEMVNDVVGGEPVTLSYCTLCGSGVLFATRLNGEVYTFGTSGLLYRSNKLMIDRRTGTLWGNLTGEPAAGPLAGGALRLRVLPVVVTTWSEWRTRHPRTTVLALDREMERRWGFVYLPGAADRRRAGVSFPTGSRDAALAPREEVFAVRLDGRAKAYPVARALAERVINDRLGETPLVVVADPASGALRAYRRGSHRFAAGAAGELVDEQGGRWRVEEAALSPLRPVPGDPALARLPGHSAFWAGWSSFFPHAELYGSGTR